MSEIDETGAIDWLLIEAPGTQLDGSLVPPLLDLVDRRLIRVLDALVLIKRTDDDFDALTTEQLDATQIGEIGELAGASSGLLDDEDAATAAAALSPDSVGSADRLREPVVAAVRDRRAAGRRAARGARARGRAGSRRRARPAGSMTVEA